MNQPGGGAGDRVKEGASDDLFIRVFLGEQSGLFWFWLPGKKAGRVREAAFPSPLPWQDATFSHAGREALGAQRCAVPLPSPGSRQVTSSSGPDPGPQASSGDTHPGHRVGWGLRAGGQLFGDRWHGVESCATCGIPLAGRRAAAGGRGIPGKQKVPQRPPSMEGMNFHSSCGRT